MARREGWEHRLADLIADAQTRVFAYGTWDCCLFACAAIESVTGRNPSEGFRGHNTDEARCERILADAGGVLGLARWIAGDYGFAEIPVLQAHRGDVVMGTLLGRDTLGVCVGDRIAFAVEPSGLCMVRITSPALQTAWRIA